MAVFTVLLGVGVRGDGRAGGDVVKTGRVAIEWEWLGWAICSARTLGCSSRGS